MVQRAKALVEPLDGSKFWRNLLRLNKYRSRKARCLKNQHSVFFKHIERSSRTVATFVGAILINIKTVKIQTGRHYRNYKNVTEIIVTKGKVQKCNKPFF